MFVGQRMKLLQHVVAHVGGVLQQVLAFDDVHVLDARGRPRGAATKGRDVAEVVQRIAGIVLEHVKHGIGRDQTGDGGIA